MVLVTARGKRAENCPNERGRGENKMTVTYSSFRHRLFAYLARPLTPDAQPLDKIAWTRLIRPRASRDTPSRAESTGTIDLPTEQTSSLTTKCHCTIHWLYFLRSLITGTPVSLAHTNTRLSATTPPLRRPQAPPARQLSPWLPAAG